MPRPTAPRHAAPATPGAGDDALWRALQTRDARFDGRFFTGVTSTGIYCRPVCAVRTPRREHCRFFTLAAQAEAAGFRPCLRCRPELAPQALAWSTQDATDILLQQALRLLDAPGTWQHDGGALVAQLAARLGVSDRHLRRIFQARLGVSPQRWLTTRRLLAAKQLLADTALPVTEVALASGFGSVRRFNAAFAAHYRMPPGQLRRALPAGAASHASRPVPLGLRPPYDAQALAQFFAQRQLDGMEWTDAAPTGPLLRRTLRLMDGGRGGAGWLELRFDLPRSRVLLQASDGLLPVLPQLIGRVRAWLDLDADPAAIDAVLAPHFRGGAGLRVPGTLDGFELAVRAVLGQQVTLAAARTLARRLLARFGTPLATPWPQLSRLFPAPEALAGATAADWADLGIVRQRQAAITALAQAVAEGRLVLDACADLAATLQALRALPGIGDWTAQYIALRALRWPDALPAGDVALQAALGLRGAAQPVRATAAACEAWRPWRGYGMLRAWAGWAYPLSD
ncbi:DNA-3-methyladenine glycosylase II [Oryzisolibacter propanilivorax]|uniref:DNA-3-methyladenine glycosylase II n=1 Tax=Oryzisolibacter propanilivorax TaxID=1527607 RepID=A0A1G9PJK6_9BURK|nr:Ada metal-binding domain-containing protein [Oryzisolibacter propanilivorax]SDL98978.1 DNA-3-methyladenine glycosylase II [Oryzisolibacter propanilivorax]